jgi:hypothetical protein
MTGSESQPDTRPSADQASMTPPGIPGLIEGSMTMYREPGGGMSFRIVIGGDGSQTDHDLLELIVSAEDVRSLSRALSGHCPGLSDGSGPLPSFPCRIGFCRNAISTAA